MKKLLFLLLITTNLTIGQNIQELFNSANDLYRQEKIEQAIEIYQKRQNSKTIDKEKKLIKSLRTEILDDKNSYQYGDINSNTTIVEFIDRTLRQISNRTFTIKNAIDWRKFTSGAI